MRVLVHVRVRVRVLSALVFAAYFQARCSGAEDGTLLTRYGALCHHCCHCCLLRPDRHSRETFSGDLISIP